MQKEYVEYSCDANSCPSVERSEYNTLPDGWLALSMTMRGLNQAQKRGVLCREHGKKLLDILTPDYLTRAQ